MAENLMPEFDLEQFIAGVNADRSKERGTNDRVKRLLMNVRDNQGTVTLIPFISRKIGNIYKKIEKVREFNGPTSVIESGYAWYKIMPIEMYEQLTPEQIELYNEVSGLFDAVADWDTLDFDTLRIRNYSLFFGIVSDQVNTDGNQVEDNLDTPCILVYPSLSPIDALNTAISNKKAVLKDKTLQWLQQIITPSLTNRKGVMQISFKKNDGPGYGTTINFETNSEFNQVIDPSKEWTQEIASKFDDPIQVFLGWTYDYDNKSYFNETVFRELRDALKLQLKELESTQNSNDVASESTELPNEMPPVPGVNSQKSTNRPF